MIDRAIILPYGESIDKSNAGAAGIFVNESLLNIKINKKNGKFTCQSIIFGSEKNVNKKLKKVYVQSNFRGKFFSNAGYINDFINKYKKK